MLSKLMRTSLVVMIVTIIIVIMLIWLSWPRSQDATSPQERVLFLHYDGNYTATFVIVKTSAPVVTYNGSSVGLVFNDEILGSSNNTGLDDYEPLKVNWSGPETAIRFYYNNVTVFMLIADLDGDNFVSNGDRFTIISSAGFEYNQTYMFAFYEQTNTESPYLFGEFSPRYISSI